jgi:hypothetical protein
MSPSFSLSTALFENDSILVIVAVNHISNSRLPSGNLPCIDCNKLEYVIYRAFLMD